MRRLEEFVKRVERGESPCLIVCAPPQHGKSLVISKSFPAWVLGNHPEWPLICASYASALAEGHGRWIRNALNSDWHQAIFPKPECRLSLDSQAIDEFRLEGDGQYLARGIGGGTTGNPAMIFIVDDPLADAQAAESKLVRDNAKAWFRTVAETRLGPGGGKILLNTRWHVDDLAGWVMENAQQDPEADQWEIVNYPAVAEAGDILGRKVGAALFPERYDEKRLRRKKANLTAREWESLYQQHPTNETGGYFKPAMINRLGGVKTPPLRRLYQAWDLALSPEESGNNDRSVGACGGIDLFNRFWLVDLMIGQWSPEILAKKMIEFWRQWHAQMVWLENGPAYLGIRPSLVYEMKRSKIWIPYEEITHGGKAKDVRAVPMRGLVNGGNMYVPGVADWFKDFQIELQTFPFGKTDDIVDAVAHLCSKMNVMLHDDTKAKPEVQPPALERSTVAKLAYAKIVERQRGLLTRNDPDDW
jgi:predicted phage terminase large subunit-like protein